MAKQAGIIKATGTVYNVCLYKLGKEYYARSKSSLTGERVKRDPVFKETMRNAGLLAKASTLASSIYRHLHPDDRDRRLYQQLTGKAIKLLKQGLSEREVVIAITGKEQVYDRRRIKSYTRNRIAKRRTSRRNNLD